MTKDDIAVSAVVFRNAAGQVLTVRKRHTSYFMLPGGKFNESELAVDTAVREIQEELRLVLDSSMLTALGTFSAAAANEPGRRVVATVFEYMSDVEPQAAAEIDEIRWTDPHNSHIDIAPLLRDEVFPLIAKRVTKSITVFTGPALGVDDRHRDRVTRFGESIADAR